MKKLGIFLICFLFLFQSVPAAFAESEIRLMVDGKYVSCDVPPFIEEGRTLIPARAVFSELGAKIEWVHSTRTVEIQYQSTRITLKVDSKQAVVNDRVVSLDVPARLVSDRTFIPVRFVAEALGMTVTWDNDARTVVMKTPPAPTPSPVPTPAPTQAPNAGPKVISGISLFSSGGADVILLSSNQFSQPAVSFLSSPDRAVFDFADAKLSISPGSVGKSGVVTKDVRYAYHDGLYTRVVVDLSASCQYVVTNQNNQIQIKLYPKVNEIHYNNGSIVLSDNGSIKKVAQNGNWFSYASSKSYDYQKLEIGDAICDSIAVSGTSVQVTTKGSVTCAPDGPKSLALSGAGAPPVPPLAPDETPTPSPSPTPKPGTPGANRRLVVVDPGHGGKEAGSVRGNVCEKDINLQIGLKVQKLLLESGFEVVMTRTTDIDVGLNQRCEIANATDAALFVSIHCNSTSEEETTAHGVEVWHYTGNPNGLEAAKKIATQISSQTGLTNRGTKESSGLVVIKNTLTTAVLVECAFLNNPKEFEILTNDEMQQQIAKGIVAGITSYLE